MHGLMQHWPLTLDRIIDHAASRHPRREIVTRSLEGPIERTDWATVRLRAKRLSGALLACGISPGDRVATLGFNTARHLEAFYGVTGIGAVCHTLNPRLKPGQLAWIVRHAADRMILVDPVFLDLVAGRLGEMPSLERIVVLAANVGEATAAIPVEAYEDFIARGDPDCAWGGFDENTAAGLCYTSGTTGDPKGVLYSHRSNFLHTYMTLQPDVMGLGVADSALAIVPMFHANGWGLPFAAPASGAKLVLPGARMDGPAIHELLEAEQVTFSAAVPTVWQSLLAHLDATGGRLTTLRRAIIGGAACPESLIRAFHDRHGVEVVPGWGMTETSPFGTVSSLRSDQRALAFERQLPFRMKQGRNALGIEMRITGQDGARLPEDGVHAGALKVRGAIVARAYFGSDAAILDADGFFDTGDVATIDADGAMQITDRAKDLIKSGGEWISSVDVETAAADHPDVALAGVIGIAHPAWTERPLLVVQRREGAALTGPELLGFLDGRIPRWWVPDEVVFVERIALGATGKIDKKQLRRDFADHVLAPAASRQAGGARSP